MTENIDKVLQRGEKLEDLIDKTTDLEASVGILWLKVLYNKYGIPNLNDSHSPGPLENKVML